MDVAGQQLDDAAVAEFLTLVKSTLESPENQEWRIHPGLMRRWPFMQEWQVVMNAGRRLFGMFDQESETP